MNQFPQLNKYWIKTVRSISSIILLILLNGCESKSASPTPSEVAYFVPPITNPALEQYSGAALTPLPTRQANCENQLVFVDDLTIPDGTEVLPGEMIVKRWLIENTGSCNWNSSYSLQLISGLALGTEKVHRLYPARQSTKAILEITFSAPDNPGRYNSWWQAYDSDGNRFGDPVYVEISVVEEVEDEEVVNPTQEEPVDEETAISS